MARASPIAVVIHIRFGFQPISAITQMENASSIAAQSGNVELQSKHCRARLGVAQHDRVHHDGGQGSDGERHDQAVEQDRGLERLHARAHQHPNRKGGRAGERRQQRVVDAEGVQGVVHAATARVVDRADEPGSERDAGGHPGRALVVDQTRACHARAHGEQREAVEGPACRQLTPVRRLEPGPKSAYPACSDSPTTPAASSSFAGLPFLKTSLFAARALIATPRTSPLRDRTCRLRRRRRAVAR